MEFLSILLSHQFMQNALLGCLLASVGCGVIGSFIVVKQIGFVAGGIAHSVLAGMGIAYFFGASPLLGAILAALVSAILIGLIKLRWKQDEDVLIAAFWSVGMSIGILFISRSSSYNIDLMSYLFGNILLVSQSHLIFMFTLDVIIVALVIIFYKQFLATAFDEEYANLRGVNIEFIYILLLCLASLTVVLLINVVGLILMIALLILPAASVGQFAGSVKKMIFFSVLLCMGITTAGLYVSYQPDLPAGSTIVLLAGVTYTLSIILKRVITRRRKARIRQDTD
jgi:zinc transport system permease protein